MKNKLNKVKNRSYENNLSIKETLLCLRVLQYSNNKLRGNPLAVARSAEETRSLWLARPISARFTSLASGICASNPSVADLFLKTLLLMKYQSSNNYQNTRALALTSALYCFLYWNERGLRHTRQANERCFYTQTLGFSRV